MKYAHTKLHLTLGGGNTWQSPLPEMIVLRKTLEDDDVDEVFFCAEIECPKEQEGCTFLYCLYDTIPFLPEYKCLLLSPSQGCLYTDLLVYKDMFCVLDPDQFPICSKVIYLV